MFRLSSDLKVFIHREAVDFRLNINGLALLVEQTLKLDPFAVAAYVFRNRRADRIKILGWQRNGFWLLCNQLHSYCTSSGLMRGRRFRRDFVDFRPIDEGVPSTALLGRPMWPGHFVQIGMGIEWVSLDDPVLGPAHKRMFVDSKQRCRLGSSQHTAFPESIVTRAKPVFVGEIADAFRGETGVTTPAAC